MKQQEVRKIDKDISIEELLEAAPGSLSYLMKKGIRCLICGQPTWGTLESEAQAKGYSDEEIQQFVQDINDLTEEENKV